jgi:hypothetical protein
VSKLLRSNSPTKGKEEEGYFCSELVAKAYKLCHLLNSKKASSSFWPIDFSQLRSIKLEKGAYFDRELTVVLNKHRKKN